MQDKSLARSTSFRPFGGGQTLCPGQHIARKAIFTFVALLLSRYDISIAPKQKGAKPVFPRLDELKPALGAMGPVAGDDVLLVLRPFR